LNFLVQEKTKPVFPGISPRSRKRDLVEIPETPIEGVGIDEVQIEMTEVLGVKVKVEADHEVLVRVLLAQKVEVVHNPPFFQPIIATRF
jgi:hypothetical protein